MPDSSWGQYELLRPAQIDAIRNLIPIAYLPWGALEWHSYHNPVGLDGLKAHHLCCAMAATTGGVVLPPVFVGADTIKPFKGFKHTLDHKTEMVHQLCLEFLEQLHDEGFKVIVILTGHYSGGQVEAIKSAADRFSQSHPHVGIYALADWEPLEGLYPANHAAEGETSFLLHFKPDTVALDQLPTDHIATLDQDGVWGEDPRNATAQLGAEMTRAFLDRTVPHIQKLLKEHHK